MASPADWQHIAFKGGSESGVINLTTWLVGQSGMNYCVIATWNNDEVVDEVQFVGLCSGFFDELAGLTPNRSDRRRINRGPTARPGGDSPDLAAIMACTLRREGQS